MGDLGKIIIATVQKIAQSGQIVGNYVIQVNSLKPYSLKFYYSKIGLQLI